MSLTALRFLHAGSLRLGVPVASCDHLPPSGARLLDEATALAFENLVRQAVALDVDFVLLHGDTFLDADRSLAARLVLMNGLELLAAEGTPVVVVPGRCDPVRAWESLRDLPETVQILDHDDRAPPIEIDRNGDVVARIAAIPRTARRTSGRRDPIGDSRADRRDGPRRLGVWVDEVDVSESDCSPVETLFETSRTGAHGAEEAWSALPYDYIAAGGGGRRTAAWETKVAHHPGVSQGLSSAEAGLLGASLVTCDADRAPTCEFLPLSPVVHHRIELSIEADSSDDDLTEAMRDALDRYEPDPVVRLLVCHWTLRGGGPLARSLADPEFQQLLVDAASPSQRPFLVGHTLRLAPDRDWRRIATVRPHGENPVGLMRQSGTKFREQAAAWLADAARRGGNPEGDDSSGDGTTGLIESLAALRAELGPGVGDVFQRATPVADSDRAADGAFRLLDDWLADLRLEGAAS